MSERLASLDMCTSRINARKMTPQHIFMKRAGGTARGTQRMGTVGGSGVRLSEEVGCSGEKLGAGIAWRLSSHLALRV